MIHFVALTMGGTWKFTRHPDSKLMKDLIIPLKNPHAHEEYPGWPQNRP